VRAAERFPRKSLAKIHERHTASGKHVSDEVAYPEWVSRELTDQARELDERSALDDLGPWCTDQLNR